MVGFFRTYTDRCHHGKEEDILFRALATKPLSDEHRRTMDRLTEEHVLARKLVGRLMLDQDRCVKGEKAALTAMKQDIHELADLYPKHIGLEEKHFFVPCMDYFSAMEQAEMLRAFTEFDAKIVHEQYTTMIEDLEAAQKAKPGRGRARKQGDGESRRIAGAAALQRARGAGGYSEQSRCSGASSSSIVGNRPTGS